MMPLALILKERGYAVAGSDRSLDQGRLPSKFKDLRSKGISLFPQDGSGITGPGMVLVTSAAVEDTVPDVVAARERGVPRISRAELLSRLFNESPCAIGVAGTSGKSTTTGMIGWILHRLGLSPTIVNGAVMRDFQTPDRPFAGALVGSGRPFVAEVDESDGSIVRYRPHVAVLNNIALDHTTLDELGRLFGGFVDRSEIAVLNLDNEGTRSLAEARAPARRITYSLRDAKADLFGAGCRPLPDGMALSVQAGGDVHALRLAVPGRHNAANALAALAACRSLDLPLAEAVRALEAFSGIARRLETVGTVRGITVVDDFAHNPDKIAATLAALHDFPGRLLLFFQPHGYGPLRLMRDAFIEGFTRDLAPQDELILCDPVYFGGTVERSVGSDEIVSAVRSAGRRATYVPARRDCGRHLLDMARPGDRIVVMGARDDSLSNFARDILSGLSRPDDAGDR